MKSPGVTSANSAFPSGSSGIIFHRTAADHLHHPPREGLVLLARRDADRRGRTQLQPHAFAPLVEAERDFQLGRRAESGGGRHQGVFPTARWRIENVPSSSALAAGARPPDMMPASMLRIWFSTLLSDTSAARTVASANGLPSGTEHEGPSTRAPSETSRRMSETSSPAAICISFVISGAKPFASARTRARPGITLSMEKEPSAPVFTDGSFPGSCPMRGERSSPRLP